MKKDIYIIKNTINDKVYIGQAKDTHERWLRHLSAARKGYGYLISRAMQKHGIQNFYYQILEYQVENYDEKEKYWINFYNSITPNGYNIAQGGNSLGCGTNHPLAIFDSEEDVYAIIDKLQNTNVSMDKIAKQTGCSLAVISQINIGATYRINGINYPIRRKKYEEEKLKQVRYSLKYELDKSMASIAKEYEIDLSQLSAINQGYIYRIGSDTYPLRSGRAFSKNKKYVEEIKDLLKDKTIPQKDIARKFNVSKGFVSSINKGTYYHDNSVSYPIRDNYQGNPVTQVCFSPDELKQIENDIRNGEKSLRKIASEHETCYSTIVNINNGSIVKYRKENVSYPIRKLKSFSKQQPVSTIRA